MRFKFQDDKICHTLPMTRHRCNLKVWALMQSLGNGHRSLVTLERVLSEYNEDLIFYFLFNCKHLFKVFSQFFSHMRHWSCDYKCILFSVNQQIRVAKVVGI